MFKVRAVFAPKETPPAGVHAWSDGTRVAIVSSPRGEEAESFPVWFSEDGSAFVEGKLDFSAANVEYLNEFSGPTAAPRGRLFKYRNSRVFEARLGRDVTFSPLFEIPDSREFQASAITVTDGKSGLWLGGHKAADSAYGWLYASGDDGKSWTRVAAKLPGAVAALFPSDAGVLALVYRSVIKVAGGDPTELAKFKDVVTNVHVDERGLFGFGETFTAFVAPGKKAKYGKFLGDADRTKRSTVVHHKGSFVMAARGGLHSSSDALGWEPIAGWDTSCSVRSLVPCGVGVLAVTQDARAFVVSP
ncbi:MAG: hypothetical protein U0271_46450 [Polyangiaceae bacterium]